MRKCWYDSLSVISDALMLTQNGGLRATQNACPPMADWNGMLVLQKIRADPNWRTTNSVGLRLVHSFSCVSSVVSEYVVRASYN